MRAWVRGRAAEMVVDVVAMARIAVDATACPDQALSSLIPVVTTIHLFPNVLRFAVSLFKQFPLLLARFSKTFHPAELTFILPSISDFSHSG